MKAVCSTAMCLFFAALLFGQDPVKVDPAHHKVLFENEYVRVLQITLAAGEKTAMHEHPTNAVVFLTDAMSRVITDGKGADTPRKANEVSGAGFPERSTICAAVPAGFTVAS